MQGLAALLLLAVAIVIANNIGANLAARQIKSGFDFLQGPAGFNIGETLFEFAARDSYLRAFAVGMTNTLRVALAGIVLASLLGVVVGLMRLSHHPLLAALGAAYVELYRNVPLLIQLLAIDLLITELLPDASGALSIEGIALLSKEGLQIAVPEEGRRALGYALAAFALGLTRRQAMASVIFPQALRLAIPPLASQYMNLIKNSSLAVVMNAVNARVTRAPR